MLADAALPPGFLRPAHAIAEVSGVAFPSARFGPDELARLAARLEGGAAGLRRLADDELLAAWEETVGELLDPRSAVRERLDPALVRLCRLSPEGLQAGLDAVLGGVRGRPARDLVAQARRRPATPGVVLVVLASNLPALAVQPLLPALALRRPTLLKSPSAEPLFAPALVAGLARRLPALADAVAAVTWRGGDRTVEGPLLERVARVIAYGDDDSIADLAGRAPGRVVAFGSRASLALVAADADLGETARGLSRDVALFDQRGCLSVQAIWAEDAGTGRAVALARALSAELDTLAERWPPGPVDPGSAARLHQTTAELQMRGIPVVSLGLGRGTVWVEPEARFTPSPGLRSLAVHPVSTLASVPEALLPWSGRLQGAALAGSIPERIRHELAALGINRCAPPGELQAADALWHNGGGHPLEALSGGDG